MRVLLPHTVACVRLLYASTQMAVLSSLGHAPQHRAATHHVAMSPVGAMSMCRRQTMARSTCSSSNTSSSSSSSSSSRHKTHGSRACACDGAAASPSSSSSSVPTASSGALNKQAHVGTLTPRLYHYLLQHTREHPALARLREETCGLHGAHMQVPPEQGALMGLLVELLGVRRAVEVGVYTGYSALAVALALPSDGRLVAFDRDASTLAFAQRHWEAAGVGHKVQAVLGPAQEGLEALLEAEGPGTFDLVFIDADKRAYPRYYELALQLLRPGGLIAADNVLFYGKVADPEVGWGPLKGMKLKDTQASDKATLALREFNAMLLADERITLSTVPVGDGMALCRKRG